MIQPSDQPPGTWREQVRLLIYPQGFLRLLGLLAIINVLAVVLGLFFMMMSLPLTLLLVRLCFVWTPIYHLAGRIMGVNGLPEHLAKPPIWFTIYSLAWAAVMLAIVAFSIHILFTYGFCSQNLICMLGHLPLK